jgi:hypothetical protein
MPVIPALGRLKQDDQKFEASQVYAVSSRTASIHNKALSLQNKTNTSILGAYFFKKKKFYKN